MKKLLTLFTLLLTVCSGAWGENYVLNTDSKTSTDKAQPISYTVSELSFSIVQSDLSDGDNVLAGSGNNKTEKFRTGKTYNITVPASLNVTKIIFSGYSNDNAKTGYISAINGATPKRDGETITTTSEIFPNKKTSPSTASFTYDATKSAGNVISFQATGTSDNAVNQVCLIITIVGTVSAAPGAISFDPAAGSVEEGTSITLSSTGATQIKYQWGASAVGSEGSWGSATTYSDGTKPEVPAVGSTNNVLSVWAHNNDGDTYGSATYTITGVDTTAPTLTAQSVENNATDVTVAGNITLTFDENVQVADASKVTLTGGAATISSVTAADNVVTIAYTGLANNTTYTLAVASDAITDVAAAQNAYAGTSFSFTTVKASMPAPKINGLGYFIGSQTVSISSDVDGATITYSLDGETYNTYTAPFEITADKTVYAKATHANYAGEGSAQMAMYKIEVPAEQVDVTAATTWDFTNADDMKPSDKVEYENKSIPKTELASTVSIYTSKEKAAQITFIKPQRYDTDGYVQAHGFIIKTTVPGTLSVKYTNGNDNTRHLIVNGTKESQISSKSKDVDANDIEIPIGTTIVYGFDVTNNPNAVNNLRYKKITFTPVTSVSGTITEAGWNTFSSNYALDLSTISGGTAYVATTKDNENVTLTETTAIVEAGEGLMIKGTAGATFTISTTTDAATLTRDNLLVGLPNGGTVAANDDNFVFAWKGNVSTAGFYFVNDAEPTLGAGKAYLHAEGVTPAKLGIIIDDSETDGIKSVQGSRFTVNREAYNLAGQKVGADYKGIVIVNGKKIIRK